MIKILILLTIFLLNHLQSYFINGISIFITSFIVFYKVFNRKNFIILFIILEYLYAIFYLDNYYLIIILFIIPNFIYYYFKKYNFNIKNIIILTIIVTFIYSFSIFLINVINYNSYTFIEFIKFFIKYFYINIIVNLILYKLLYFKHKYYK